MGFLPFFVGTVLIPFSLALLWKNEKKLVNFVRMLEIARNECRSVNIDTPVKEANLALVHAAGNVTNFDDC